MQPGDYPIELCVKAAGHLIGSGLTVLQKFTCAGCGNRLTMSEPNVFFETGTCDKCDHTTIIKRCNYLVTTLSPEQVRQLMGK